MCLAGLACLQDEHSVRDRIVTFLLLRRDTSDYFPFLLLASDKSARQTHQRLKMRRI